MSNIISELGSLVTSQIVKSAASSLGESEGGIGKVIGALAPTILGGLVNKSSDSSGFGQIFDMLGNKDNASYLDNLGGLIGGGNLAHNDPKDAAGGLLSSLFGDKMGGIIDMVASIAGVKKSSSSSLLGMVAPMIMGYLGKKILKEGLSASGLSSFLGGQRNNIADAMPNQLADMIGFEMPDSLADKAVDTVKATAGKAANVAQNVADTAVDTANTGGNMLMKVLPLLLLGIVGLFAWKQCGNDVMDAGEKMVDVAGDAASATAGAVGDVANATVDAAGNVVDVAGNAVNATVDAAGNVVDVAGNAVNATVDAAGNAVDAAGNAIAGLGDLFKRKLANGMELSIPEFGIESKLLNFLDDAKSVVSKDTWYDFDRINFATGSASLDINKSQEQLSNIAQIMKAYPGMTIKIGGYTDNTGDAAANLKLSEARANTVKNALANLGVAANRITTEGYGIANPVATNDTEEGRAKNRRIAVRITKK